MSSLGGADQTLPWPGALAGGLGRLVQTGHDLAGGLGRTSPRPSALAGGLARLAQTGAGSGDPRTTGGNFGILADYFGVAPNSPENAGSIRGLSAKGYTRNYGGA